jgi:dTDP-4-dehydrorhamnose reductase
MRIAVTGAKGQVAMSLIERTNRDIEIVPLSRPAFALEDRQAVLAGIKAARPDVVVNAAAYTAVDKAEAEEELAIRVNGEGAGHVAEAAAKIGAPLLHLSTDYVFDGALDRPYREDDPTGPTGSYGRSKLLLNETRDEVGVVADQHGNPTSALDIADALLALAKRLRDDSSPTLRGVFHLTGSGEATWADLAEAVFEQARVRGRRVTRVKRITTADYPTPARRPANSRLDSAKLRRVYGAALPDWRGSVAVCCARLIA